jgi:hypothetical protein
MRQPTQAECQRSKGKRGQVQLTTQLEKQYANASQAEREAALENWYQQNAGQFALMRQQAQTFPEAGPPTAN